jgi:hypothetical protein
MREVRNIKTRRSGYRAAHAAKGQNESWHDTLKRLGAEDPTPDECPECGGDVDLFIIDPLPGQGAEPQPVQEARVDCADCDYTGTWYRGEGVEAE